MAVYITRCPSCQQAYRLNDTQLSVKDGLVRCGFCQNVFNAKEHLYRSKDVPTETAVIRAEREAEMERKGVANMAALSAQLQGFDAVDEEDNSGLVGIRTEPRLGPVRQDVINGSNNSIEIIQHEPQRTNATVEYSDDEEDEEEIPVKKSTSKRALWIVIALIAALLIGLQLSLSFRGAIIEKLPQSEAMFNTLCQYFVCQPIANTTEATPEEPKNVVLASQSLQRVGGDEYVIVANLHNEKAVEEIFPEMTVVLKGEKGDILTRRILKPSDYLNDASQKLKPNETRQVAFTFKISEGVPNELSIELGR